MLFNSFLSLSPLYILPCRIQLSLFLSASILCFHFVVLIVRSVPNEGPKRREWKDGDSSSSSGGRRKMRRRGLWSSHQRAAMTSCHSCHRLWEIFCQGKANSSSFTPNRTVRPSEQAANVVSLELRALLKSATVGLPHATCNKRPPQRDTWPDTERAPDRLHCNAQAGVGGGCTEVENSPEASSMSYTV